MIITIDLPARGATITTEAFYKYDRGHKLKINNAPDAFVVEVGSSDTFYPDESGVIPLPDALFENDGKIELFVVAEQNASRNTLCKIIIPVIWRPARGTASITG